MRPFLVGIAGLSGSGKSALAARVAEELKGSCSLLSIDSYYLPLAHLSIDERARANFDHPDALDWRLLTQHLSELLAGGEIEEPKYLFDQHTRAAQTTRVEPRPFVILEGILALHRHDVRDLLDLRVFVTTDVHECLRRRMARDVAERGRTAECVLRQYEATVWPMAQAFVLPSREFADVVVSGEEPLDLSVAAVMRSLERPRAASA